VGIPPIRHAPTRLGPNSPLTTAHLAASGQLGTTLAAIENPFLHAAWRLLMAWTSPIIATSTAPCARRRPRSRNSAALTSRVVLLAALAWLAVAEADPEQAELLRGRAPGPASASRPAHAADAAAGRNQLVGRGRQTLGADRSISVRRRLRLCHPIGADPLSQRASNRRVRNRRESKPAAPCAPVCHCQCGPPKAATVEYGSRPHLRGCSRR